MNEHARAPERDQSQSRTRGRASRPTIQLQGKAGGLTRGTREMRPLRSRSDLATPSKSGGARPSPIGPGS
jgi:hypothetical protein